MGDVVHRDPAERSLIMGLFYRAWRPTFIGRWVGRMAKWWCAVGLPSGNVGILDVDGGAVGARSSVPMVIATVDSKRYVVSMLGSGSNWVRNVEATNGNATLQKGSSRHAVHLVAIPPDARAPILREYVRVATSGRKHFPVAVDAPLSEFERIAERYPVYRIDPA
jgi:hypothetical protein